jgi:hypothetical protein
MTKKRSIQFVSSFIKPTILKVALDEFFFFKIRNIHDYIPFVKVSAMGYAKLCGVPFCIRTGDGL